MAKTTVKAECESCNGTGIYCGFAEPKGTGVVCIRCQGSGATELSYTPFTKRKKREGVHTVRLSAGVFIGTGVGPRGASVTYDEFLNGKMPRR